MYYLELVSDFAKSREVKNILDQYPPGVQLVFLSDEDKDALKELYFSDKKYKFYNVYDFLDDVLERHDYDSSGWRMCNEGFDDFCDMPSMGEF